MRDPHDPIEQRLRQYREAAEDPVMEQDLVEQISRSFRGRQRRFTLFAMMKLVGCLGIAIASGVWFFQAEVPRDQLLAAVLFGIGVMGYAFWWLVYWLQLQRNAELRELKRLELQIAELAARFDDSDEPPHIRLVEPPE